MVIVYALRRKKNLTFLKRLSHGHGQKDLPGIDKFNKLC